MNNYSISSSEKRAVMKDVEAQLKTGLTRKELFDQLSITYQNTDALANIIAQYPEFNSKLKYKKLNHILIYLLLAINAIDVLFCTSSILHTNLIGDISKISIPFTILSVIINFYFILKIFNFRGYIYKKSSLIMLLQLIIFYTLNKVNILPNNIFPSLIQLLMLIYTITSLFISKKLFPNYTLKGPKKSSTGTYKF